METKDSINLNIVVAAYNLGGEMFALAWQEATLKREGVNQESLTRVENLYRTFHELAIKGLPQSESLRLEVIDGKFWHKVD